MQILPPPFEGVVSMAVTFTNAADLVKCLGNIPLDRICFTPPPGTATERDLRAAMRRKERVYEFVDGTLVEKQMGLKESIIAGQVLTEFNVFVRRHDLGLASGEAGTVRLLEGLVRAPDVAFFCWDELPGRVLPEKPTPDLAVEVLSKGNTPQEMQRKLREYSLAGTRLVWMIDHVSRRADVYTASGNPAVTVGESKSLDGGEVLPGFTLSLDELFAHLPAAAAKKRSPRKKKH
jgi:Uma2 family endonuclease